MRRQIKLNFRYVLKNQKIILISVIGTLIFFYLSLKSKPVITKADLYENQRETVLKFHQMIHQGEFKVYSQQNEDGILDTFIKMFDLDKNKYYVEIGTQSGIECNSRYLREKLGWQGDMFDGGFENSSIGLHKEIITHWNILDLFKKYNISKDISILSEDTDYADYWIVEAILSQYSPKVLVHEVNQMKPPMCVTIPKEEKLIFWDKTNFHGGSVCAFRCLAMRFNYTLVYCESNGVDCFMVRNDVLEDYLKIKADFISSVLTPEVLYSNPGWIHPNPKYQPNWTLVTC